jgi:hypothetical protein
MVKFIAVIRIKPSYDPDETWEVWKEHTITAKKILSPELKQYTIHRAVKTFTDSDIFGVAMAVFDDIESLERAFNRLWSKGPDEWMKRFQSIDRIVVEYEEVEL